MTRPHPYLVAALFVAGGALVTWLGRALAPGELVMLGAGYLILWGVAARDFVRRLFGPVFAYELTRLGRKRGTFVARFLYVAVIGLLFVYWYLLWRESIRFEAVGNTVPSHRAAQFADQFFIAFALAQFGAIFLLAPAFVAGTVAQEKERKTLEFLLATDLTGSEIVFGKAAARLITVLQFVVAGLGVIVFLQLFGGIDPDLLLASTAAASVTAMGITALGLFYSVRARRPREAILATALTIALYLAASFVVWVFVKQGLPGLMVLTPYYTVFGYAIDGGDLLRWITAAASAFGAGNPLVVLTNIGGRGGYTAGVLDAALRNYVAFWVALSAFWLAYAVLRLRPIALRQAEGSPARRVGRRAPRPRPAVGGDPIAWKEVFAERGRRRPVLLVLVCAATFVVPCFLAAMYFSPDSALLRPYFAPDNRPLAERLADLREGLSAWMRAATVVIGFIGLFAAASRGAGAIAGEKDRDTWVTLSSLPVTPWQLARGKWLGAALAPRRVYALLLAVWALGLATGAADPPKLLLTATYFAAYASAFAWLGVWCSVTAKSTLSGTVRALFAGLFAAGGFWLVPLLTCSLPMGLFRLWGSGVGDAVEEGAVALAAMTPPFMLGALPAPPWESARGGVFGPNHTAIGPAMPLAGLLAWLAIGWLLARRATAKIARALNRAPARSRRGTGSSPPSTRPRSSAALP